jgi:hypothetical protein
MFIEIVRVLVGLVRAEPGENLIRCCVFRALPILLALAIALAPSPSRAQSSAPDGMFSASIAYTAPATCPSSEDFKAVVVARLGFDPFSESAPRHVLVSISEGEQALDGRLEWRDAQGEWAGDRTFPARSNDCPELVRTMGFALAVQIHLLMTGQPPATTNDRPADEIHNPLAEGAKASGPPAAAASTPDTRADVGTHEKARSGARWAFALGAGASLGAGMSPSPTVLGRLFGSAALGRVSFEVGGEISTETSADREDGAGFSQRVLLASAAACGTEGPFSLCVLGKGGTVMVRGQEIDVPATPTGAVFQAGLRVGARQTVGSAFIAERLEGVVNVTRWTVTLDGIPVWTAPAVAGTLGVDVGVIFQ